MGRFGWLRATIGHTGELVWLNLEVAEAAQALVEHTWFLCHIIYYSVLYCMSGVLCVCL